MIAVFLKKWNKGLVKGWDVHQVWSATFVDGDGLIFCELSLFRSPVIMVVWYGSLVQGIHVNFLLTISILLMVNKDHIVLKNCTCARVHYMLVQTTAFYTNNNFKLIKEMFVKCGWEKKKWSSHLLHNIYWSKCLICTPEKFQMSSTGFKPMTRSFLQF